MDSSMWFFLAIGAIAFFGAGAVSSWAEARRKEREAFYRSETLKRFSESNQPDMLDRFLAGEKAERLELGRQRRESLRLGGLIAMMAGIGVGIMLAGLEPREKVYLCGVVPFLVGLGILIYVYFMAPRNAKNE